MEELKGELRHLQMKYDQVVEHKTLIQQEREDVSLVIKKKNAMKTADVICYLVSGYLGTSATFKDRFYNKI